MNDNKKKTIIFANTAEAFKEQLMGSASKQEGQARIRHELVLSQRSFFWEDDNKIIITPSEIPVPLFKWNKDKLGLGDVENYFLKETNIDLSSAVIKDQDLWLKLVGLAKKNYDLRLSPYAITPAFMYLAKKLENEGVKFRIDEEPKKLEVVNYLDSKAGFREVVGSLSKDYSFVKIPEGFVCSNFSEAVSKVIWFFHKNKSCVIKANTGESGWGVMILKVDKFDNETEFSKYIEKNFIKDNIWENGLLIVEEYIYPDIRVSGGSPSSEMFISNSRTKITYSCEQVVGANGEFLGVGVGREAVPVSLRNRLESITDIIGQKYQALGYRGFFDVDFVISSAGIPYAVETNTRRTGGTHVYDLGRRVFGNDLSSWGYLLSSDSFVYGKIPMKADKILEKAKSMLFPIKSKNKGLFITLINEIDPILGYIVIGSRKKEVINLQGQFKKIWGVS